MFADRLAHWDPMAVDYLSIRNSYKVDVDDPGVAALGYSEYMLMFLPQLFFFSPDHAEYSHSEYSKMAEGDTESVHI